MKHFPLISKEIKNAAIEMRELTALDYVREADAKRCNKPKTKKLQETRTTAVATSTRILPYCFRRGKTKEMGDYQ